MIKQFPKPGDFHHPSYNPSHVLKAMGMNENEANECVRFSWCHLTPEVDWNAVANRISDTRR